MARGVRLNAHARAHADTLPPTVRLLQRPGMAWLGLCALLALGSALGWALPKEQLDWQPALALQQPWRAFTAAFVHWSALHLGANLAGTLVLAALGWAARVPWPLAVAWCAAWPLSHVALGWQPALLHYGGLSGVLHGGVAAVAVWVLGTERRLRPRALALAILVGLLLKLWLEQPWGPALREVAGWDVPIAPLAHATGATAGALLALGVALHARRVAQRTGLWPGGAHNSRR